MLVCLCVVQGCFVLKGQSCTVAAQVAWPTELKMITNWSFVKEIATLVLVTLSSSLCLKSNLHSPSS